MSTSIEAVKRRERAFEVFARAALEAHGEHIEDIILYGSVARGDATERSDVDVLVILQGDEPPEELSMRPNKLTDLAFDVGLEHDVKISVYIKTSESFEARQDHPFLQSVRRDGRSFREDD